MIDPALIADETATASFFYHLIMFTAVSGGGAYILFKMITMQRVRVKRMGPKERQEYEAAIEDLKIY